MMRLQLIRAMMLALLVSVAPMLASAQQVPL